MSRYRRDDFAIISPPDGAPVEEAIAERIAELSGSLGLSCICPFSVILVEPLTPNARLASRAI
jgi:hypothetical protein